MVPDRGEVTERLKVLASKASVRETVPWVRIPPSPPFLLVCFLSVQSGAFPVYLWRPLRFEERHWIVRPGAFHIRLRLFLALAHPWRVMPLCDLHAGVSQENRNTL